MGIPAQLQGYKEYAAAEEDPLAGGAGGLSTFLSFFFFLSFFGFTSQHVGS